MANNNEESLVEVKTTAIFTQEEYMNCFDSSDGETSDEEEFDAKAWRQSIRDLHRDLEMKKYAYYRRIVLLEQRERKENRKRIIREALERSRREEAARERQAQQSLEEVLRTVPLDARHRHRRRPRALAPLRSL